MLRGRHGGRETRRWHVGEHAIGGVGTGHCVTPEVEQNGTGDCVGTLLFCDAVVGDIIVALPFDAGLLSLASTMVQCRLCPPPHISML